MTAFDIKLIAILTMLVDHIGLFFFPHDISFRLVGRIAFPLFSWLIANGAHYTKNMRAYLIRLFIFAFISQAPYYYANRLTDPSFQGLNVLFTLFLGLSAIAYIKQDRRIWKKIGFVIFMASVAFFLKTDYDFEGVVSVVSFYIFFNNFKKLAISQSLIILFLSFLPNVYEILLHPKQTSSISGIVAPFGLLSLILIRRYNNKEGVKAKYLFYVIYPLQFALVYIAKVFFLP